MEDKLINTPDYRELRQIINANHDRFSELNFDNSFSTLQKVNAIAEWFKVVLQDFKEVVDYLDDFQAKFDEKLYNTVDDVLKQWVADGSFDELLNKGLIGEINKRIDSLVNAMDNKVSKQYVDNLFNAIGNGSPSEVFQSVEALRAKYPNGTDSIVLVYEGSDLYIYYYDTQWRKGSLYQSAGIGDNTVTDPKIYSLYKEKLSSSAPNLMRNTLFESNTNLWGTASTPNAVLTNSNNTLISTGNGVSNEPLVFQNLQQSDVINGHQYYINILAKVTNDSCQKINLEFSQNNFAVDNPLINTTYSLGGLIKLITSTYIGVNIKHIYSSNSASNGKELVLSKPFVVDLTKVFGAGNEPTEEQCKWIFKNYAKYFLGDSIFLSDSNDKLIELVKNSSRLNNIESKVNLTEVELKNVFPNPRITSTSYWLTTSVPDTVITASNNRLTLTGNGSAPTQRAFVNYSLIGGRWYYIRMRLRVMTKCSYLRISQSATEIVGIQNPEIGKWYELESLTNELSATSIYIRGNYDSNVEADGSIIEMEQPILIDLTNDLNITPTMKQLNEIFEYTGRWFVDGFISKNNLLNAMYDGSEETTNGDQSESDNSLFYSTINNIPAYDGTNGLDMENMKTSDIYALWNTLIGSNSGYFEKTVLGKDQSDTWEIWQIKTKPRAPKYKLILTASVHGHGAGGDPRDVAFSFFYFIKDMVENPLKSSVLEWFYNNVKMVFIPVANPSGFDETGRYNSRGVDINRNFDYNFPSNPTPTDGTAPFSEKESQYIRDMVLANQDASAYVDLHCFMNNPISLMYPAYSGDRVGIGWITLNEVGSHMVKKFGGTVQIDVTDTAGTIRKWVENKNGIEAITVEGTVYIQGETAHSALNMKRLTEWYGNNIYRFVNTIPWNKDYFVMKNGNKMKQVINTSGNIVLEKIN